jgi:hypothetical protein
MHDRVKRARATSPPLGSHLGTPLLRHLVPFNTVLQDYSSRPRPEGDERPSARFSFLNEVISSFLRTRQRFWPFEKRSVRYFSRNGICFDSCRKLSAKEPVIAHSPASGFGDCVLRPWSCCGRQDVQLLIDFPSLAPRRESPIYQCPDRADGETKAYSPQDREPQT